MTRVEDCSPRPRRARRIKSPQGSRFAPLHCANAQRRPGRHTRHRQVRRGQCALLAAAILGAKYPAIREAFRKLRTDQTGRVLANPDPSVGPPPARRRGSACDHRHPWRRTARLHARSRGLSARFAFRFSRSFSRSPRGPHRPARHRRLHRSSRPRKISPGGPRVGHLRIRKNVPVEAANFLAERVPVYPPPAALEAAQDRLAEKDLFRKLGIATTEFAMFRIAANSTERP